jgi:hypothetical protein
MKIAEGLAMCGERGQWIIGQLDINDEYCAVIVGVLAAAAAFLKKVMTEEDLKKAHTALVDALALAEAVLPMQWSTITTHMLLHAADWVPHNSSLLYAYAYDLYMLSFISWLYMSVLHPYLLCFVRYISYTLVQLVRTFVHYVSQFFRFKTIFTIFCTIYYLLCVDETVGLVLGHQHALRRAPSCSTQEDGDGA